MFCLLIGRLLQHKLRQVLQEKEQRLITPGGRPNDRPTADHILDMAARITVILTKEDGPIRRHLVEPPLPVRHMFALLKIPLHIFTKGGSP